MFTLNRKFLSVLLSFIILCPLVLSGCQPTASKEPLSRTEFVLGTTVTITLYSQQSDTILDEAFSSLTKLEDLLSINKTDTLIDNINDHAGISPVAVDEDTFNLLKRGLYYSQLTNGYFDITIGPLVKLWHIGFPDAKVPSDQEIASVLPLIDYRKLILDEKQKTAYLETKGMQIDLGGIAKGYATDQIVAFLKEKGVKHAIIDLGGNIFTLGSKPGGSAWNIGIQDPFNPRGDIMGTLKAENKSAVTSGIYERFLETEDGKKYHHLLNPATGYPYDNHLAGVTIISNASTDGDALSTSAFALGLDQGLSFIEAQPDTEAIFITTDHKVYLTSGLKSSFSLTSSSFTLCN